VVARRGRLAVVDRTGGAERVEALQVADPLGALRELAAGFRLVLPPAGAAGRAIPAAARGGWFGYAAYDTVRYAEPGKLPWERAPADDRTLPDLSFALYDGVVVFDHVDTLCFVSQLGIVRAGEDAGAVWDRARGRLEARLGQIQSHDKRLAAGRLSADPPRGAAGRKLTPARHPQPRKRCGEGQRASV